MQQRPSTIAAAPPPAGPRRQAPRNIASILDSARELGIRDAQASGQMTPCQQQPAIARVSGPTARLSVSNSLSGRHWELDQVPAVGDLTDIGQLGTGHHVSVGEGQRRVALQRRVAAYLVGGGQTPRNVASILDSARELGIRDAQDRTGSRAGQTNAVEGLRTGAIGTAWPPAIWSRLRCSRWRVSSGTSSSS